jgi:hypothetical protein
MNVAGTRLTKRSVMYHPFRRPVLAGSLMLIETMPTPSKHLWNVNFSVDSENDYGVMVTGELWSASEVVGLAMTLVTLLSRRCQDFVVRRARMSSTRKTTNHSNPGPL